jgi:hypothetical protein
MTRVETCDESRLGSDLQIRVRKADIVAENSWRAACVCVREGWARRTEDDQRNSLCGCAHRRQGKFARSIQVKGLKQSQINEPPDPDFGQNVDSARESGADEHGVDGPPSGALGAASAVGAGARDRRVCGARPSALCSSRHRIGRLVASECRRLCSTWRQAQAPRVGKSAGNHVWSGTREGPSARLDVADRT